MECKERRLKRMVSFDIDCPELTLPSSAVLLSEASAGVKYAQTPFLYPTKNKSWDEGLEHNHRAYQ